MEVEYRSLCKHPDIYTTRVDDERAVEEYMERGAPDWCPLRTTDLVVSLRLGN